ncbi:sporulation protein YqfD [Clostridiisalibacter paucivorans]|uniref:sporulation protein YqfD n=1 Tax=Clostridiisalibacter paucivorans TaxID=408753 RepID=UPI0004797F6D|nr:sporulation protein YqfD [Clostridiisalibacter paucivorans]
MLVIRIWNYFRGYVIIKIEGLTLERFINMAVYKGLYLWDIERIEYTILQAKIGVKSYKKMKSIIENIGCKVEVVEKKGYPFLIHRLKSRKAMVLGFFLSMITLFFLTSFIWVIDIESSDNIDEQKLLQYLYEMDIKPGIRKSDINIDRIDANILRDIEELSYAHGEINGVRLVINAKKRSDISKALDDETPCSLVAKKKAVIEKIVAKQGKALVKKGDVVEKGEPLISGIISDETMEEPLFVHAEGEVLGRTLYRAVIKEPIFRVLKTETGKKYTVKELKLGEKRIMLMNGEIPFKEYREVIRANNIPDKGFIKLPIDIIVHEYRELEVKRYKQNIDAIKKESSVKGTEKIIKEIPDEAKIVSKEVNFFTEEDVLEAHVIIEVIEDIVVENKIP